MHSVYHKNIIMRDKIPNSANIDFFNKVQQNLLRQNVEGYQIDRKKTSFFLRY